jgi:23S rRNA maturation-related 3'-5' exoribonuclease YhaM
MQIPPFRTQQSDIEGNKDLALSFLKYIQRPGIESLLDYLLESDYFTAPASTRYHNFFPGGLCLHSLNLVLSFAEANRNLQNPVPEESVVICGLLHGLCKVGAYIETDYGYETVKGLKGHATLSISRINEHIHLTQQEDDIIRYHMGLFGIFVYKEHYALAIHRAIVRTPQVQIFAALDMADSKRKVGYQL